MTINKSKNDILSFISGNVIKTIFSHGYGQVVTLISSLLFPFLTLKYWGAADYGYWLTISSFTQFWAISDLGSSHSIANQLHLKKIK